MQRPSFFTRNGALLAGVLLGATAFIAACSPDLVDDPGYHLVNHSGHLDADPTTFMAGVGCTVQSGADSSGSVAIKLLNGAGMSHFRCPGVAFDSIQQAIASYRAAARDSVGGAAVEAGGGDDGDVEVLALSPVS